MMDVEGKSMEEMVVGQKESFTKTITETDVVLFGGISGDLNPAHFNEEYAKQSIFKARVAHGCLCSSLFSTVLGMHLPGPGTIYLSQESKFLKPVYIGDTVTAVVEVVEMIHEKNRIVCDTTAYNQKGEKVIVGKAVVMPPKKI
jgi:3-hydroxybutyryl-CoA dehydratase